MVAQFCVLFDDLYKRRSALSELVYRAQLQQNVDF